jgi:HPt (histidine-containing phosphotransfer) domain-containing protein
MDLTALVPKDMLDLLSAFLPNRRADVARLRAALAADDWAQLQHLVERLYAVGNPYGFRQITTFGRLMREACAQRDETELERLIHAYAEYLSKVVVVEVDAPVTRVALSAESRSILVPNGNVQRRRKHAVVKVTEAG